MIKNPNFKPREYQEEIVNQMFNYYDKEKKEGLVVVPTGGGKTSIASYYMWRKFQEKEWNQDETLVLWMAHNIDLLAQTRDSFLNFFNREETQIISSRNSSFEKILGKSTKEKLKVKVLFASYLSCSTKTKKKNKVRTTTVDKSFKNLELFINQTKKRKVFVVIDEAHRASAPTYQRVIKGLRNSKNIDSVELLGLTATPIRMTGSAQERLNNTFNLPEGRINSKPTMSYLMEKGYLSWPNPITIKTDFDTKKELKKDGLDNDLLKLKPTQDLPSNILKSIGRSAPRNHAIVKEFVKKGDYGKTIVFAADILHCQLLEKEFDKQGVKVVSIYSKEGNCASATNDDLRGKFEKGEVDVIINVNMLTEGIDIPKVKTVFLARPTRSVALFRQMVGRALRGEKSGGTKYANLVTFVDSWDDFSPIEGGDVIPELKVESELFSNYEKKNKQLVDFKLILNYYNKIKPAKIIGSSIFDPKRLFRWNNEVEGETDRTMISMSNWDKALSELIKDVEKEGKFDMSVDRIRVYFEDCPPSCPVSDNEILQLIELLEIIDKEGDYEVYSLDELNQFTPQIVIKNVGKLRDTPQGKYEDYFDKSEGLQKYYKDFEELWDEINETSRKSPVDETPINNLGLKLWDDPITEGYDLNTIAADVLKAYKKKYSDDFLSKGKLENLNIRYTKANRLGQVWAFHSEEANSDKREIVFHSQLNSPDVPRFVIEGIMFHELVHNKIGNREMHKKNFRELEKTFAPSKKAIEDVPKEYETLLERNPIRAVKGFLNKLSKSNK